MYARTRLVTIGTILAFGTAAMLLIPGSDADTGHSEAPEAAEFAYPTYFDDLAHGADQLLATSQSELAPSAEPDAGLIREQNTPATPPPTPSAAASAPASEPPAQVLRTDTIATAVNLRAGPGTGADKVDVLQAGQSVSVIAEQDGWTEVALADGRTGWVYGSYLGSVPPARTDAATAEAKPATARTETRATIKGGGGDLTGRTARIGSALAAHAGPSSGASVVFTLRAGSRVRILEQRGGWILVSGPQGSGWIRAS